MLGFHIVARWPTIISWMASLRGVSYNKINGRFAGTKTVTVRLGSTTLLKGYFIFGINFVKKCNFKSLLPPVF